MVCGNVKMEDAKITGMTPPALTRRGRWVDCPPITLRPTTLLAYCTGIRRSLRSTYTMNAPTTIMKASIRTISGNVMAPQASFSLCQTRSTIAARQSDHDAGKNQQRHSIAYAALGDLFAQPHNESAARGQGQHRHQAEAPSRESARNRPFFQADGDAE